MKKRVFAVLAAVLLVTVMFCLSVSAFDANDYDYGSSGGGGFSYSYSDDDFDGGGDLTSLLLAIAVVAVLCVYWSIKGKIEKHRNKNKPKTPPAPKTPPVQQPKAVPADNGEGTSVPIPNRTVEIRDILRQSEPGFSEQEFLGNAVKLFSDIRGAICARNAEVLRSAVTPGMLGVYGDMVRSLSERHISERCESLAVTNAYLTSLVREGGSEYLTVCISARYVRFLTDDLTGNVVEGNPRSLLSYRWLMTFSRSAGASAGGTGECPHCGAPVTAGAEKCEYCGGTAPALSREWLMCKLDTVHDDTADNGIRL